MSYLDEYEDLGNISAVDPAYSRDLVCHRCEVHWVGCYDQSDCQFCGRNCLIGEDPPR